MRFLRTFAIVLGGLAALVGASWCLAQAGLYLADHIGGWWTVAGFAVVGALAFSAFIEAARPKP